MNKEPYVLDETDDFAVIYKPPKMHSVPLDKKPSDALLKWYMEAGCFNNARQSNEVGQRASPPFVDLLHRLDYETHGLVLAAKNLETFEFFKTVQERDEFVKEYSAVCRESVSSAPTSGFPPPPFSIGEFSAEEPLVIESWFRPYGPGRKLVRPVIDDGKKHRETAKDKGGFYRTEITGRDGNVFTTRIRRGFRHQIRCHLCWIGFPILNDPLYGEHKTESEEQLALCAHALSFTDPSSGEKREYRIAALKEHFGIVEKMPY